MDKLESSKTLQFGLHQECSVGQVDVMFGLKDGSSVVVHVLLFMCVQSVSSEVELVFFYIFSCYVC